MSDIFDPNDFSLRHIGPSADDIAFMLAHLGLRSLAELSEKVIPPAINHTTKFDLPAGLSEQEALARLAAIAQRNKVYTSLLGCGYYNTVTPPVIQRNVLENPAWYTAYTPYQPEIAQGRLEGLLNYQQMIMDLSGLDMANASMLDEATAAAEAMAMARRQQRKTKSNTFFIDEQCFPQTIAVVKTRAEHFGFNLLIGDPRQALAENDYFGALLQNPGRNGEVRDLSEDIAHVHARGALAIVAADLMSLVIVKSPGEMGADIVVGSNQRFGIPMGFGGPHAGFFAFREAFRRSAPGRIIGVSVDTRGAPALRMALQTREQHIRREKANSNICTAQVLLALMSGFYAVYHGPRGLRHIATRIHTLTNDLATGLATRGFAIRNTKWFDTLTVDTPGQQTSVLKAALAREINLRPVDEDAIGISLDETSDRALVATLLECFGEAAAKQTPETIPSPSAKVGLDRTLLRRDAILSHPVFNSHHSETDMLRYLKRLENKDISLANRMIPLGSCTMKLNATAEMMPVSWPEFAHIHPLAPSDQIEGYRQLFDDLETMLVQCTGYDAVSLQPNAGSQGEYAGLVAIKNYLHDRGEAQRDVCLIPASAHGTNPASAQMAGMNVVVVRCDERGNIDIEDLRRLVERHSEKLAALMVTYPSTHGVFEDHIVDICDLIHQHGGQIYIDGANLNAMVGLCEPGRFGGDVSHINLHKTFCIPHGGGGPGMGPIAVAEHLKPYLPGHVLSPSCEGKIDPATMPTTISAAPWGSALILTIPWIYIMCMGGGNLKKSSQVAVLNANYMAQRLDEHYPVLYRGNNGLVAHECIIDIRGIRDATGVNEEDIAKRLMDYGFHAPTMSFPVPGTLMIEPTESESLPELDRFIEAMISIRREIDHIARGEWDSQNNPLKCAPHTVADLLDENWNRPYSRQQATHPAPWLHENKVWPAVNRIDQVYGDRNLVCSCPPLSAYAET